MEVKQVIVMRTDLNMRKGKMCAQASHASMKVILDLNKSSWKNEQLQVDYDSRMKAWLVDGTFKKIVVGIGSEVELLDLYVRAQEQNIHRALIRDNGLTEFNGVLTNTCIALGPEYSDKLDLLTGHLKLL